MDRTAGFSWPENRTARIDDDDDVMRKVQLQHVEEYWCKKVAAFLCGVLPLGKKGKQWGWELVAFQV